MKHVKEMVIEGERHVIIDKGRDRRVYRLRPRDRVPTDLDRLRLPWYVSADTRCPGRTKMTDEDIESRYGPVVEATKCVTELLIRAGRHGEYERHVAIGRHGMVHRVYRLRNWGLAPTEFFWPDPAPTLFWRTRTPDAVNSLPDMTDVDIEQRYGPVITDTVKRVTEFVMDQQRHVAIGRRSHPMRVYRMESRCRRPTTWDWWMLMKWNPYVLENPAFDRFPRTASEIEDWYGPVRIGGGIVPLRFSPTSEGW